MGTDSAGVDSSRLESTFYQFQSPISRVDSNSTSGSHDCRQLTTIILY